MGITLKYVDTKKIIVGKKVEVDRAIRLRTGFNCPIRQIVWRINGKVKSCQPTFKHTFKTEGKKKITVLINNRLLLQRTIRVYMVDWFSTLAENEIGLKYLNQSSTPNLEIVTFQQNVASSFGSTATAWCLMSFSSVGEMQFLTYSPELEIAASDQFANFTPRLAAEAGQRFTVSTVSSGNELALTGSATDPSEVQMLNSVASGTMNAHIYRTDKLLSSTTGLTNGQIADFEFRPTIWVGAVSGVTQGQELNSTILSTINTEISLLGIKTAEILITDDGSGGYQFSLANITFS